MQRILRSVVGACVIAALATSMSTSVHAQAKTVAVTVPANAGWVDSGLSVAQGDHLDISATGTWSNTSSGGVSANGFAGYTMAGTVAPSLALGSLIARIGSEVIPVGTTLKRRSPSAGSIFLSMNDVVGTFGDNTGTISVTVTTTPFEICRLACTLAPRVVSIGSDALSNLLALALLNTRIQVSQTDAGTPLPEPAGTPGAPHMSYIRFSDVLKAAGAKDNAFDVAVYEHGIDQWPLIATVLATHTTIFVDQIRAKVNNLHVDFDASTVTTMSAQDELIVSIKPSSPDPTIVCEGYGYSFLPFGFPIPVGWQDGLCPDVNMTNMNIRLHLKPAVASDGTLTIADATVEFQADMDAGALGNALDGPTQFKNQIKTTLETQFTKTLLTPAIRKTLGTALTRLFELQAGKAIPKFLSIAVAEEGMSAEIPRR